VERRFLKSTSSQFIRFSIAALAIVACASSSAMAGEARPWLCRDKPVFSYNSGMRYEVTSGQGRAWRMFFMAFDPTGGHDGFEIVRTADLVGGTASGVLESGRYFAVAMYRQGGNWICPGYAQDRERPPAGELNNICYGEDGPPCLVTLAVSAAH
jgi:hypothetical protein